MCMPARICTEPERPAYGGKSVPDCHRRGFIFGAFGKGGERPVLEIAQIRTMKMRITEIPRNVIAT